MGIRQTELREVMLPFPPLVEQKAIARILGVLDDKIELNRRMNHAAWRRSRRRGQEFVVDFDPVIRPASLSVVACVAGAARGDDNRGGGMIRGRNRCRRDRRRTQR